MNTNELKRDRLIKIGKMAWEIYVHNKNDLVEEAQHLMKYNPSGYYMSAFDLSWKEAEKWLENTEDLIEILLKKEG